MTSRKAGESAPKGQRSVLRRIVETLVIAAIAVGLDVLLVYALYPYGSTSEVVWSEYFSAADKSIDTVIVGSSTAQRAIDPNVLDDTLGTSTFTLATPAQPLEDSYLAVREALSGHKVRRVILGLDYETMSLGTWDKANVTYVQTKAAYESLPKAVGDYVGLLTGSGYLTSSKFLEVLFPWTLAHEKGGIQGVANNLRMRLDGTTPIEAAGAREPGWTYVGKGYGNYDYLLDTSNAKASMSTTSHAIADFTDENMGMLQRIADVCHENGAQLVVVVTPRPAFNVLCYGDAYPEQMARMRDLVQTAGGVFLDANLLKRSCYAPTDEGFADGEHLNATGAEGFSPNYAYCPVLFKDLETRERVYAELKEKCNVFTRRYFYPLLTDFAPYADAKGSCPVAEDAARRVLTLPTYYGLSADDARAIAGNVLEILDTKV